MFTTDELELSKEPDIQCLPQGPFDMIHGC